jgi:hypothetical protein
MPHEMRSASKGPAIGKTPPTQVVSITPRDFSAQASKQAKRPTIPRIEYLDEEMKLGGTSRTKYLLDPLGLVARADS